MGNPTAYYCDPAIAGNSGTGTLLDPFGDLQYALNTIVRDATNGDQVNIKAGTAEVLAASLTLATYGTPTNNVPLILRGYTASAGDGGMGAIDCNGNTMWVASYNQIRMIELDCYSFGNNNGVASAGFLYKCKLHKGASTPTSKNLSLNNTLVNCWVYDAGTTGQGIANGTTYGCYVYNCVSGIAGATAFNNIIVDCTNGLVNLALGINNSIFSSTANTGSGITSTTAGAIFLNNIIEGYSGVGGKGISLATNDILLIGYNTYYNCTTPESFGVDIVLDLGQDGAPASSPFIDAAGGNFVLAPAVVGAIENAFPGAWYGPASTTSKQDRGAVQNGAGTGGMLQANKRGNKQ